MKISDLIKLLAEEISQHGDIEVFIEGSNAIYLDALPFYYDGGGHMLENGKWYSTRHNYNKCGKSILHLKAQLFDYGGDFTEYYDDIEYPEITFDENWTENYNKAIEKYREHRLRSVK